MSNRAQLLASRRRTKKGIKIPRSKVLKIVRVAVVVIFFFVAIYSVPRIIPIHSIQCETDKSDCSQILQEKINTLKFANLYFTKSELQRILNEQVSVKNYSIRYQLPGILVVYVIERVPVVAIAREGATSDFALVDQEGVIIGVWDATTLPIMIVNKNSEYQAGQRLPEKLRQAIIIADQSYNKFNSRLSLLKSDVLEVELPSGIHVIFPISGDLDLMFGSLSLILSRLNSDTIKLLPSIIDLRYKNPVIK